MENKLHWVKNYLQQFFSSVAIDPIAKEASFVRKDRAK